MIENVIKFGSESHIFKGLKILHGGKYLRGAIWVDLESLLKWFPFIKVRGAQHAKSSGI